MREAAPTLPTMEVAFVKETVRALAERLKEVVPPAPFRLFIKVLDCAVTTQLLNPDGTIGHINPKESTYRGIEKETAVVRDLVFALGYEPLTEAGELEGQLVMYDLQSSRPALSAFHDYASSELAETTCLSVKDLLSIDNIPLLVAHLGYNFFLRLQRLTLGTPHDMLHIVEEEVNASSSCIDFITARLHVMVPGSPLHAQWNNLKKSAVTYTTSFGTSMEFRQIEQLFGQVGGQLAAEVNAILPSEVAAVFGRLFGVVLVAGVAATDQQPVPYTTAAYLDSCETLCVVCPTEEFQSSIDTVRACLMKTFDGPLSSDDLDEIAKTAIWQTQNFIYHFEPATLSHVMESVHIVLKDVPTSEDSLSEKLSSLQTRQTVPLRTDEDGSTESVELQPQSCPPDVIQSLREAMSAVRQAVKPYPWRLFLKTLRHAASIHAIAADGTAVSVNTYEMNFCAVDVETNLTRQLLTKMGYQVLPGERLLWSHVYDIVMLNVSHHREALSAFCRLAEEEIASSCCPGVEQLQGIDNVPLLVAHLAYNFHIRVTLFVYISTAQTLCILEEDIHTGLDCVEFLARKLELLQSGSGGDKSWSLWRELRQAALKCISSEKRLELVAELKSKVNEVSNQFQLQLALRVNHSLVQLFNYVGIVQLTAGVCISGEMLVPDNIHRYMDCYDDMPPNCMSGRYMESVDKIRELLLRSFDAPLTRPEVIQIAKTAIWQTRNFIYHFHPEVVTNPQCPLSSLLGMGQGGLSVQVGDDGQFQLVFNDPAGSPTVSVTEASQIDSASDGVESDSSNEEEKVDISEKESSIQVSQKADNIISDSLTQASCSTAGTVGRVDDDVKSKLRSQEHVSQTVAKVGELYRDINELEHALTLGMPRSASVAIEEAIQRKRSEIEAIEKLTGGRSGLQTKVFDRESPVVHKKMVTLPSEFLQSSVAQTLLCQKTGAHAIVNLSQMLCEILGDLPAGQVDLLCHTLGVEADDRAQKVELIRSHLS